MLSLHATVALYKTLILLDFLLSFNYQMQPKNTYSTPMHEEASPRPPNLIIAYDYTLRCAIYAFIEQNGRYFQANNSEESIIHRHRSFRSRIYRHSVHLSTVSDILGNFTDKLIYNEDNNQERLTKPVVIGLLHRLDSILDGKDSSKKEYLDHSFLVIVRQIRMVVKQHRYRPKGSINDILVSFRTVTEVELEKIHDYSAAWREHLTILYIELLTEVLCLVLEEDAPNSASPELVEALKNSILQKNQKKLQPSSPKNNNVSSTTKNFSNILDAIENFFLVKKVQDLFQVNSLTHKQKISTLYPICTESVSS